MAATSCWYFVSSSSPEITPWGRPKVSMTRMLGTSGAIPKVLGIVPLKSSHTGTCGDSLRICDRTTG